MDGRANRVMYVQASPASVRAKEEVDALRQSTLTLEATMGSPLKELRTLLEMPFMQGEVGPPEHFNGGARCLVAGSPKIFLRV